MTWLKSQYDVHLNSPDRTQSILSRAATATLELRFICHRSCHYRQNPNQRTSGPVNAHLIPGPGIYFNAFVHVYSPRAGADNPFETKFDDNRKAFSLCPYVLEYLFEI